MELADSYHWGVLNIRRFVVLLSLGAASLLAMAPGCQKGYTTNLAEVERDDPQMNAAIESARRSVGEFIAAFEAAGPAPDAYAVRRPYPVQNAARARDGDREHIWLDVVAVEGGQFRCVVFDEPEDIADLKAGDTQVFDIGEITDWMYYDDQGRVVGGWTVRVLYERAPVEDRARRFGDIRFREMEDAK